MEIYKQLYHKLFNAMTDAITAIDQKNYGLAEEIMKKAQQDAEELYLSEGEE